MCVSNDDEVHESCAFGVSGVEPLAFAVLIMFILEINLLLQSFRETHPTYMNWGVYNYSKIFPQRNSFCFNQYFLPVYVKHFHKFRKFVNTGE